VHVLITGGAGFLGSHLCERYLRDGHRVTCLDSMVTGSPSNVAHLRHHADFRLVVADVADFDAQQHVEAPLDAILHFACPASPPQYMRLPMETINACSDGTRRLLETAQAQGARILIASTSEIYGDPVVHPQVESYWGNVNPIGVRSVYDESKRFSEMLTAAWHRSYGTNTAIVRIFNTYGPRMNPADGRAIPNLITQALAGAPLTVYGSGSQTRSFCYFSDLVEGIVRLLASDEHAPVNLGNPTENTLVELAELVRDQIGTAGPIEYHPLPQDDPTRRCPDIARARALLGWEPRVALRDGLRDTIAWFRESA
jgi:nucleoside-diphosphate-sugar epimerase